MGAVATLTAPGGVLRIDVPREPNIVTLAARISAWLQRSQAVLNLSPSFPPYHVWGFNPRALAALLDKHGFDIEDLDVRCNPRVPHNGTLKDRGRSTLAGLAIRLGNRTRTAPYMTAWARRRM